MYFSTGVCRPCPGSASPPGPSLHHRRGLALAPWPGAAAVAVLGAAGRSGPRRDKSRLLLGSRVTGEPAVPCVLRAEEGWPGAKGPRRPEGWAHLRSARARASHRARASGQAEDPRNEQRPAHRAGGPGARPSRPRTPATPGHTRTHRRPAEKNADPPGTSLPGRVGIHPRPPGPPRPPDCAGRAQAPPPSTTTGSSPKTPGQIRTPGDAGPPRPPGQQPAHGNPDNRTPRGQQGLMKSAGSRSAWGRARSGGGSGSGGGRGRSGGRTGAGRSGGRSGGRIRGASRGRGRRRKAVSAASVEPHRLEGVFLYRGAEDALATRSLVPGLSVYGERRVTVGEGSERFEYRTWNPFRSKLAAAILGGVDKIHIRPRSRVLYLGAASGATVSHVSDIVGPDGVVYAVEVSPRAGRDLVNLAKKRTNIVPVLEDARHPLRYRMLVGMVDVLVVDVAQPDQASILAANAHVFLRNGGHFLVPFKAHRKPSAKSSGRSGKASGKSSGKSSTSLKAEFAAELRKLQQENLRPQEQLTLEPYEWEHAVVVGVYRPRSK
ncbi:RNA 2'-O-methyltransferase FBLL1 [Thomomys bottae]